MTVPKLPLVHCNKYPRTSAVVLQGKYHIDGNPTCLPFRITQKVREEFKVAHLSHSLAIPGTSGTVDVRIL